ncbi:MAG: 30S ribosomal protein S6 [Gemmatimonadota bacterium]|nr:30S ribosomal protein S6 [Gemmatimonadota bacterium]MDH3367162.1 30S ribosomal protein S6 [Gemmatimonadota bacterium]MDH3478630.1 30S ribosomal protein S6 [Gemmatimonadota bacterium]MDH3570489.1 30S ribosomal protein S6 [Gemmatimonadota bacterium]MDH5548455.1 30S ribosomal protein S6 [Gemmatimonadota bacterium]
MTREYEIVYIFDSTLEEAQINERLERFQGLLRGPESPEPVTSVDHWGKRTLSYAIAGRDVGYYVVARFETQPEKLPELERAIKLDEGVIRHLIVLDEGLTPAGAIPEPSDRDDNGHGDSDREDDE